MLAISRVESADQVAAVQGLLREYMKWAFTLSADSDKAPTFQGFDKELATLPGVYTPPTGCLLLALHDGQAAGCVGFKANGPATCELKRLYVRPSFRGLNIGRQLVHALVQEARAVGYRQMVLDSHISMKSAHRIYQSEGFTAASAPSDFPPDLKPFVIFMECNLRQGK